ncbi:ribonuclease H-like domain-containing protein, partial [Tanacetum coccineum]
KSMDLRVDGCCADKFLSYLVYKKELVIPRQTATGKESSNPFIADSLLKTIRSDEFHQIVDFLASSSLKYALTTHPTIYVSLIEQFWQTTTVKAVNDGEQQPIATVDGHKFTITEASIRRHLQLADVEGVHVPLFATMLIHDQPGQEHLAQATTSTPVIEPQIPQSTSSMPHDSPLSGGYTPTSVEGSLKLNELTDMCTKLVKRVTTLETELKQTKQVYGKAITKLVNKVKNLETKLKISKVRRKTRLVLSDEEDNLVSEAPSKQGRIEVPEVEDVMEERQAQSVQDQSTSSFEDDLSLLKAAKILADASTEKVKTYKKRRRIDSTKVSTDEGTAKEIFGTAKDNQGTDEEIARKIQEEEQAKELEYDIDWKTIIEQVQEQQSGSMIRYQALKKKPTTVAQATKNMKVYLKNMAGYRMTNFKGKTYDQIRPIFEKEYNNVQTLFQKDPEKIEKKRVVDETLLQESFKKLRTAQASSSEPIQEFSTTEPKELSQEDLKKMMQIVPVEEVKVEVLQVKYPITDWEILSEGIQQKVLTISERQAEQKRKLEFNAGKNQGYQQQNKRQNTNRAYTARPGEKREYTGSLPLCTKCHYHHKGPCAPRCNKCKKIGHLARDCRSSGPNGNYNNRGNSGMT